MSEEVKDFVQPPAKKLKTNEDNAPSPNAMEIDFSKDTTDFGDKFIADSKYSNFITLEELEKLREFKVLDEVKSNEEDSDGEESDNSDEKSEDIPDEEIEKMLEDSLPDHLKGPPKPKEKPYVTRQKIMLEEKGVNPFEVLPLDWMTVRHQCGMPIYVHKSTRVCTLSKPYFLGKGNMRRHDIPISAIPCLAYRRALEEEEKQKEIDKKIEEQIKNGTWVQNAEQANTARKCNVSEENQKEQLYNTKNETIEGSNIISVSKEETNNLGSVVIKEINNQETDIENSELDVSDKPHKTSDTLSKDIKTFRVVSDSAVGSDVSSQIVEDTNISKCPFNYVKSSVNSMSDEFLAIANNESSAEASNEPSAETSNVYSAEASNEHSVKASNEPSAEASNDHSVQDSNEPSAETSNEPSAEANNGSSVEATKQNNEIPLNRQPVVLPGGIVMPPPRVESVNTSWKTQQLTSEEVNNYCKNLFRFKTVSIMHFNRWADRRKYTKIRKALQYPTLPAGTKLITIPAQSVSGQENGGKVTKRDWVMNMNGRCYLSVFHEYVNRALKKQPVYEFKQLENAATPYQATVFIGGMQYGVGHGSSKRQAKSAAARASIHILIPEMRDQLEPAANQSEPDFTFFDYVSIEDPRIAEFCAAACEPSPHAILRTCLLRNFGAGDRHIHTEMKKLEYQKIELTMKVGKHSATVVCKNKKMAKQRASQAILQKLHPHVRSWGSLLRLYGSRSVKSCKEKKLEEQQITLLQDKARRNEPNHAVLEKLRADMRRLRERDAAVAPVGTLLLPTADLPPSASDLNRLDL